LTALNIFNGLNEAQKQVVTATQGPVLVVAGPGSGKTLTIVRRIAYLIHQEVRPENILAVTFTNRAAREMQERAAALLGRETEGVFIGTFHLLGLRIVKDTLPDHFVLYNREEQVDLLKALLKGTAKEARQKAEEISRIKGGGGCSEKIDEIYETYQSSLTKKSAFDFDDLILKPIEILNSDGMLEKFRDKFRYIIVDEYQDINPAQYRLLKLLAGNGGNICAVGDADQAIYAFRGADIDNFLDFGKDFKDVTTITLTENFRSAGTILNASDAMINNNQRRIDRKLSPVRNAGSRISIFSVPDEKTEGEVIIREIEKRMDGTSHFRMLHGSGGKDPVEDSYIFSDFAVIFRTNAQARAIEEVFLASGIPFQVVGRRNSLQKKEIMDIASYFKSIIGQSDNADEQDIPLEAKLLSPADIFDPQANAVALMTLHMAKGLEFKTVFIAGVEAGLIPFTIHKEDADIEEERRLFYVGMTRAKDELLLLHARNRFLYGQRLMPAPSPFLREVPEEFVWNKVFPDKVKKQKQDSQPGLF
jgi:DNA helicase-2/ATP-dependent DNA helicase PcrA